MNLDKYFFITGIAFLILFFFTKKRKNKFYLILPLLAIVFLFGSYFLPISFLGKWNAIKELNNKEIKFLILQPSQPHWEVNLVDSEVTVINKSQIEYLSKLLQNVEVYFPNHPVRIWETRLIFVTADNDSLPLKIEKIEKNEAVIYTQHGKFKRNDLAEFLEEVVKFNKPAKSK